MKLRFKNMEKEYILLRLSARNPATARWGALDCKRKLGIPGTRLAIRVSPNAALSQVERLSASCSRLGRTRKRKTSINKRHQETSRNKQLYMQRMQACMHLHRFQVLMNGCTLCAHLDSSLVILRLYQHYFYHRIQRMFCLLAQMLQLAHWFQTSGKLHFQSLHDMLKAAHKLSMSTRWEPTQLLRLNQTATPSRVCH